ncbi:outer membrane beta-barrel protein [Poritiphilus flavus]|uniref:Outer membrane beta-barrel protein n=1 Tax=Poritiphilus flavus TaxID=2697053 RepID=A0A6L9EGY0_9FLAO|nr:outer membrane beta-barrel protein [Poritiphilus flavus]NAS14050.1 outer membrane beta-barrel protein [Poritiphilus flavus]
MRQHKKLNSLLLYCSLLLFTLCGYSQEGWMAGAAPSLELEYGLVGVNSRLYYGPNPKVCFGPEFTLFPYQAFEENYDISIVDLNLNAHYIFELSHKFGVYPLAGINHTTERERFIDRSETNSENAFGLNYGLGFHINVNQFFIFSEFKGVTGELNGEFLTVGVIFLISKTQQKAH